jgi:hypothetical protein
MKIRRSSHSALPEPAAHLFGLQLWRFNDGFGSDSANQADFRLVRFTSRQRTSFAEAAQADRPAAVVPKFSTVRREPHADIELLGMVVTWDTGISVLRRNAGRPFCTTIRRRFIDSFSERADSSKVLFSAIELVGRTSNNGVARARISCRFRRGSAMPEENLKPALRRALQVHEIGDETPYRLFFAAKGKSGASFGFMQGDLAGKQPVV